MRVLKTMVSDSQRLNPFTHRGAYLSTLIREASCWRIWQLTKTPTADWSAKSKRLWSGQPKETSLSQPLQMLKDHCRKEGC